VAAWEYYLVLCLAYTAFQTENAIRSEPLQWPHASAPMHSHATWPTMRRLSYNEMQMAAENAGFGFREANNQRDERRDTFAALRRR
jgi:hypothetical protein